MDIVTIPLGSLATADLSISGGALVLSVKVEAKAEIDALLAKLAASVPAEFQPLVAVVAAAVDSELAQS